MKEFDSLLQLVEHLLGPDGCPWDREQTLQSVRSYILEEAYELVDAIEKEDTVHIQEELGDFIFTALFLSKLAEKEKLFQLKEVIEGVKEKLIRRHPHVFLERKVKHLEELFTQWEEIKKAERKKAGKKSPFANIPKALPALMRAQKVLKKLSPPLRDKSEIKDEQSLSLELISLVKRANELKIDAEQALRESVVLLERNEEINFC